MLDCAITGGTLIDGTGAPGRRADLGIRDGRIASISESGALDEQADRIIDASGRVVAPGFVDIHTHFDAQVFWDPDLSPAPLHGVTTAVGGNCGFSLAPLSPDAGDYLMRMLSRVEGMPLESLRAGVPWDWKGFGDYLSRLDGNVAINLGFLVGHSALRRVVMGDDAVGNPASRDQLGGMVELLHASLAEGGLGFSSSQAPTHNDGGGHPVPSRAADAEELVALAGALRDHEGTSLEFIPTVGPFGDEHKELMTRMSLAANRPLNWNVLAVGPNDQHLAQLSASDYAAERGARVLALTPSQVMTLRLNFISGFVFDAFPHWAPVIALPLEERAKALSDPAVRERLREGAVSDQAGPLRAIAAWENMIVGETFLPENADLSGRKLGPLAAERGIDPFDLMLDLAVAEDLRTSFTPDLPGDEHDTWLRRAKTWLDPRTVIGASDAGAHLDMIDTFTCTTSLLGPGVRERGLISLEEAIHQISDLPARLYGIRDRGRLVEGWCADVVVFDPLHVGPRTVVTRFDLPAGAGRLYAGAEGIHHVLVNGTEIVRDDEFTKARPGRVLRSGHDTETVAL